MAANSGGSTGGQEMAPVAVVQQLAVPKNRSEDPPWNGWDVTRIALMLFVVPFVVVPFVAFAAKQIFYPSLPWITVAQKPWIALTTQFVWYVLILVYMIMFVEGTFHRRVFGEVLVDGW